MEKGVQHTLGVANAERGEGTWWKRIEGLRVCIGRWGCGICMFCWVEGACAICLFLGGSLLGGANA